MTEIQARLAPPEEETSVQKEHEPNVSVTPAAMQAVETITYAGTVCNEAGEPIEGVAIRSRRRRPGQMEFEGWELLDKSAPGLFVDKWINAENVTLEQYRGKVVVLQIGVLLPKDPVELERMQTLLNEYGSQGLQVIAIHQRPDIRWAGKVTEDDLHAFVAAHGITFPFAIDAPVDVVRDLVDEKAVGNGAMYSLYDVKATPALYLIDKTGILRISPRRNEVDAWIKRLLGE